MFKSVRNKLLAGDLFIIMLFCLVSFWAIFNFISLSNALDRILVENYRSVLAAENMIGAIERQDSAVLYYLLNETNMGQSLYDDYHSEFMMWFGREEENITVEGEAELVKSIGNIYSQYISKFNNMKVIYEDRGQEQAFKFYQSKIHTNFTEIRNLCKDLLEMNQSVIVERDRTAKSMSNKAIWSTAFVYVIALLIGFLWDIYLSSIILGPIQKLTEKVKNIARGMMDEEIDIKTNDEIGILATEFNNMTKNLKEYQDANIDKLIAERKKSETIVREIYDGIIVIDNGYRISLVNRTAENILLKRESEVLKRHYKDVINDEIIIETIRIALDNSILSNKKEEIITVMRVIEGVKKFYTIEVTIIEGKDGRFDGAVIVLGDVTHFKEIDDIKSEFVSIVSHEFRTPLTSIQLGVGLLLESKALAEAEKEKELLYALDEESKRLNRLVEELLELSRIESGRIKMEFKESNISDVIDTAVRLFEIQTKEKDIRLQKLPIPEDFPKAYIDADKILWVLTNLVGNSIRYTPNGGRIDITAEQSGNKIMIAVKDTGSGIPKKYQDSIFNKFTQIKSESTNAGGAGLGLAISKEIIKAHKGRIWVESEEGKGSKFIFMVPISV